MRLIALVCFLVLAALVPAMLPVAAQSPPTDLVVKATCASAFHFPSLAALQDEILLRAKRDAANELFGELIVASTTVDDLVVTADQIRLQTLGLVRLQGSASYSHGSALGDICVTISAYATAEDRAQFRPTSLSQRECIPGGNLIISQARARAEEQAKLKALTAYDPRLAAYPTDQILPLLRQVSFSESGFLAGTETYCATVGGSLVPIEVVGFLALDGDMVSADTPILTQPLATQTPTVTPTATPTATPRPDEILSPAQATSTAAAATVIAFQSRTPTPTPTWTATPDATTTSIAATAQAMGTQEAAAAAALVATAQAIGTQEAWEAATASKRAQVMATAEAAGHTVYDVWINPVDNAAYLYVPPGPFLMGKNPGQTVHVDAFWIMQTTVTNAQYARCVQAGACTASSKERWQQAAYADHPVTQVDWHQATTYAAWAGGRLPTETEWEKAARGTDGRIYPWGDSEPTCILVNYSGCGGATKPVGSHLAGASPYGALDMAGNVWEWTADAWEGAPTLRVVRGGSGDSSGPIVRTSYRYRGSSDFRNNNHGFRVMFSPHP